jgi:hypothetical protein
MHAEQIALLPDLDPDFDPAGPRAKTTGLESRRFVLTGRKTANGEPIRARYSAGKPCDARCIYAKGPNCECSCSGANHGIGHTR